jgi:DUF971 family protein
MALRPFERAEPQELAWTDDGSVRVRWDDGHESIYTLPYLRERCPCASCMGTHGTPTTLVLRRSRGGLPIVEGPKKPPAPAVQADGVQPVGNYAVRFKWGDGHDAGIYSYRYLRSICLCPQCQGDAGAHA